jgi:hypothetical protein
MPNSFAFYRIIFFQISPFFLFLFFLFGWVKFAHNEIWAGGGGCLGEMKKSHKTIFEKRSKSNKMVEIFPLPKHTTPKKLKKI